MSDEGFKRLMEIETKYRTHRSADQLHAIALFPKLFDDFPVPVIINAAILKLADYYRNSNNIQRHAVLQVVKKSEPHLKKLLNVEETIKRISPTLHSNDPLARALTLSVIHSLDSSEAMEVNAAVYAADRICAQSQKFCAIISGKLAFMVRDSKTPLPLRRRLIKIFGHMFEDITLARKENMFGHLGPESRWRIHSGDPQDFDSTGIAFIGGCPAANRTAASKRAVSSFKRHAASFFGMSWLTSTKGRQLDC
ncbi:Integrator complex subunit 7 [Podila clonocystis]|nr:Integrator complex subunit 7 [Podila clonocystis]